MLNLDRLRWREVSRSDVRASFAAGSPADPTSADAASVVAPPPAPLSPPQ